MMTTAREGDTPAGKDGAQKLYNRVFKLFEQNCNDRDPQQRKKLNRLVLDTFLGPLKRGSCRSTYGRNNAHRGALVCEQHNRRSFQRVSSKLVEVHTLPEMMDVCSTDCSVTSDRACNLLQGLQVGPLT